MKEQMDFVEAEEELKILMKTSHPSHWMPKNHHGAKMNNFLAAVSHEMKNAEFSINDVGDPRTASQLMHHALAGSRKLIIEKLQQSRRRAEQVKAKMATIPLDIDKDNYLIKRFLADSLPGYRRRVAEHYLFIRTEVEERFASQPDTFLKICVALTVIYMIGAMAYIAAVATVLGSLSSEIWLLAVITATVQDIFVVQPMKIFGKYVLVIETIRDEVLAIFECFSFRAKTLIRRKRGMMTNSSSLLQHFNPACRAARMNPTLPSSRILIGLTDFDLPVSHRLKPIVPERTYAHASVRGVGPTANASSFVKTAPPSPKHPKFFEGKKLVVPISPMVPALFFVPSLNVYFDPIA